MKTVVSVNEISEFEIKPKQELEQWRKLVADEIAMRWKERGKWKTVGCPVCQTQDSTPAFSKLGFVYEECNHCKTVYAKNRPSENELHKWYTSSAPVAFWQDTILRSSAASREEKIIEPRANWILDGLSEYLPRLAGTDIRYTDISFFGKGLVEKIISFSPGIKPLFAGIPGEAAFQGQEAVTRAAAFPGDLSSIGKSDVVVAIDVLERIPSIHDFLQQLETVVENNGLVFATCPVASGFEIQSLWQHSPSIIPPDKLNLPTVKALLELFSLTSNWKVLELSTPGMFDVELVRATMRQLPAADFPRSLHALMDGITRRGVEQFTEYLQSQRLCSFARIVLQRTK